LEFPSNVVFPISAIITALVFESINEELVLKSAIETLPKLMGALSWLRLLPATNKSAGINKKINLKKEIFMVHIKNL